jgi:hypothetical protein
MCVFTGGISPYRNQSTVTLIVNDPHLAKIPALFQDYCLFIAGENEKPDIPWLIGFLGMVKHVSRSPYRANQPWMAWVVLDFRTQAQDV